MHYVRHYGILRPHEQDLALRHVLKERYGIESGEAYHPYTGEIETFSLDVPENHPQMEELEKILPHETSEETARKLIKEWREFGKASAAYISLVYLPVYSEEERLAAEWLSMYCSSMKVLPADGKVLDFARCSSEEVCQEWHRLQKGSFVTQTTVKWGRRFFVSSAVDENVLFCSEVAKRLLKTQGLSGCRFDSVIKRSTGLPMGDIFQLRSEHQIDDRAVVPAWGMGRRICDHCGMHMLESFGQKSQYGFLKNKIDTNIDFYELPPILLGTGNVSGRGFSESIVSQRMYRILKEKKMDRGLVFTPIPMVD